MRTSRNRKQSPAYLVDTNLSHAFDSDYRSIFTEEVHRNLTAYAHGAHGSSPSAEQNYVYDKFRAARGDLPDEVTVLPRYDTEAYLRQGYRIVYADAVNGDDGNAGTKEAPLKTLYAALLSVRGLKKAAVCLRAGVYIIDKTICLDESFSGTTEFPLILTAYPGEAVRLTAASPLRRTDFSPVQDDDELAARIPATARPHVLYADLRALGWCRNTIGHVSKEITPTLYINDVAMDIARYPNRSDNQFDLLYFEEVEDTGSVIDRNGSRLYTRWTARVAFFADYDRYVRGEIDTEPDWQREYSYQSKLLPLYESKEEALADYRRLRAHADNGHPVFTDRFGILNMDYGFTIRMHDNEDERADQHTSAARLAEIAAWKSLSDRNVMIYGNAYEGWDWNRYGVRSIDQKDGYYTLTTTGGSTWGAGRSSNSPTGRNMYYFYNAIEALDTPGEWYIDEKTGRLYLYPTADFSNARIDYCATPSDILTVEGANNLLISGIHFDKSMSRGIYVHHAQGVVIQNCLFTGMTKNAAEVADSERCAVLYSNFRQNRSGSIAVGGEASVLDGKPSFNIVQNNHIDCPIATQSGIILGGYGNCVSHNTMDLSQITLCYSCAMENIVEYNDIRGGHTDTSDAGLIYMNGYSMRCNHIRYNYLHHWHMPGNGIYLDDLNSSNYVYGNIIDTTEAPGRKPRGFVYTSTGHDHVICNNFCIGRTRIDMVRREADGTTSEKHINGLLRSSIGEQDANGTYPLTLHIGDKVYTIPTEMEDKVTSRIYSGESHDIEGLSELSVWNQKTSSDSEGDALSVTMRYPDGSEEKMTNYCDRINQSWLYHNDACWLGYRFKGFSDAFLKRYRPFARPGTIYERRLPELLTYLDLFEEHIKAREESGYRVNPLEIFLRSVSTNIVRNNIVLGVPDAYAKGAPSASVTGVDVDGNETVYRGTDTDLEIGNFDCDNADYDSILPMIREYQSNADPRLFRRIFKKAEKMQRRQQKDYVSLAFVLKKAGRTEK